MTIMNNWQKTLNILLVEDDKVDVMNVKRAFRQNNVSNPLFIAENGIEALKMLQGNYPVVPKPYVILLDINMPKMNGIEFLKTIRNDHQLNDACVFVLTTSNEDRDKVEAYNFNVAGYILKPLSYEKFLHTVATLQSYWELIEIPD